MVLEASLRPAGAHQEQIEFRSSARLPIALRIRRLVPSILQVSLSLSATESQDTTELLPTGRWWRQTHEIFPLVPGDFFQSHSRCMVQKVPTNEWVLPSKMTRNELMERQEISQESIVHWSPEAVATEVNHEVVLMNLERNRCYGLGSTGSDIWRRLGEPIHVSELLTQLRVDYDAPSNQIESDVLRTLREFAAEGLIEVSAATDQS